MKKPSFALLFGATLPFVIGLYAMGVLWVVQDYTMTPLDRGMTLFMGLILCPMITAGASALIHENWNAHD